jgi:transcriptional regulator with XRE-family HTH domain
MNTSELIKQELAAKKASARYMARQVNMSIGGFHAALKNNTFKLETLKKIAEVLEIDVSSLLEQSPNPNPIKRPKTGAFTKTNPIDHHNNSLRLYRQVLGDKGAQYLQEMRLFVELNEYLGWEFRIASLVEIFNLLSELQEEISSGDDHNSIVENIKPKVDEWIAKQENHIEQIIEMNRKIADMHSQISESIKPMTWELKQRLELVISGKQEI